MWTSVAEVLATRYEDAGTDGCGVDISFIVPLYIFTCTWDVATCGLGFLRLVTFFQVVYICIQLCGDNIKVLDLLNTSTHSLICLSDDYSC